MFFINRPKLLIGGAIVFAVLFVVGSYFGSHWYYGDIEPVPEHLLTIEPYYPKAGQEMSASDSQDAESPEWESVPETEALSGDDAVSTPLPDITDDELDALLQELEESPVEKGDFPEVPDGFPSDLIPVWIQFPDYQKGDMYKHEMIDRVLIKLWNQEDHDFVSGVYQHDNDRVYPLYRDVVYIEWGETVPDNPDEEVVRFPRFALATHQRSSDPDALGGLFTVEELTSGAYQTMYSDVTFVDYGSAGYDPETFLDDH